VEREWKPLPPYRVQNAVVPLYAYTSAAKIRRRSVWPIEAAKALVDSSQLEHSNF
jgi:hypothetical protein